MEMVKIEDSVSDSSVCEIKDSDYKVSKANATRLPYKEKEYCFIRSIIFRGKKFEN